MFIVEMLVILFITCQIHAFVTEFNDKIKELETLKGTNEITFYGNTIGKELEEDYLFN